MKNKLSRALYSCLIAAILSAWGGVAPLVWAQGPLSQEIQRFFTRDWIEVVRVDGRAKLFPGGHDEKYYAQDTHGNVYKLRLRDPLPTYAEVGVSLMSQAIHLPNPLIYPVLMKRGLQGVPSVQEAKALDPGSAVVGLSGARGDWISGSVQALTPLDGWNPRAFSWRQSADFMGQLLLNGVVGNGDFQPGSNIAASQGRVLTLDATQAFKFFRQFQSVNDIFGPYFRSFPVELLHQMSGADQLRFAEAVNLTLSALERLDQRTLESFFGPYIRGAHSWARHKHEPEFDYLREMSRRIAMVRSQTLDFLQNSLQQNPAALNALQTSCPLPSMDLSIPEATLTADQIPSFEQDPAETLWAYYFQSFWGTRAQATTQWTQSLLQGLLPPYSFDPIREALIRAHRITIDGATMNHELSERSRRVFEFEAIKREAARRGLRLWLFGGTAASYAHYVKSDLQREKGDRRFQDLTFDYDYTNIFRSTQDLDIVVDGSAAEALEFEQWLKATYKHFLGNKEAAWEVRSLREPRDTKGALLDDYDFAHQHTDSHSTGMIELTAPPAGECVVRDLRDFHSCSSQFLRDVLEGKIKYYHSTLHGTTQRFLLGKNPPILSVIRYLTKAFQYELEMRQEDLDVMKAIVASFDPAEAIESSDVLAWMNKNVPKIYGHAVNIEYAQRVLDFLGLRAKLMTIGDISDANSPAYWMSREPLRSQPVGLGTSITAGELGIDVVAHETRSFLAYESMTRSRTGAPNVFISRQHTVNESACHGDGFYTLQGRHGQVRSGLTIRYRVNPAARAGTDFIIGGDDDPTAGSLDSHSEIIWLNKQALEVIPESLNLTRVEFFQLLASEEGHGIDYGDRALIEKMKRRSFRRGQATEEELAVIRSLVDHMLQPDLPTMRTRQAAALLKQWFELPESIADPGLVGRCFERGFYSVIVDLLQHPHWRNHPQADGWIERLVAEELPSDGYLLEHLLNQDFLLSHPRLQSWLTTILQRDHNGQRGDNDGEFARQILPLPHWRNQAVAEEWIEEIITRTGNRPDFGDTINALFSDPFLIQRPKSRQWIRYLIDSVRNEEAIRMLLNNIMFLPEVTQNWQPFVRDTIEELLTMNRATYDAAIAWRVLTPERAAEPQAKRWFMTLFSRGKERYRGLLVSMSLYDGAAPPPWIYDDDVLAALETIFADHLDEAGIRNAFISGILDSNWWIHHPRAIVWARALLATTHYDGLMKVFSNQIWNEHPEGAHLLLQLIEKEMRDNPQWRLQMGGSRLCAKDLFSMQHWKQHPVLLNLVHTYIGPQALVTLDTVETALSRRAEAGAGAPPIGSPCEASL